MILNDPIEDWPIVECLISFYSSGFPFEKALKYVEVYRPFLVNDLHK
jgi:inositol hexakisphosphate/diphosphoinositol-pentakisphosphate kinase